MDQEQTVETVQTVEGLGELTEQVDSLVEVLTEQVEQSALTPEELEAEQQAVAEQQALAEQQAQDEAQFRTELLLSLEEVQTGIVDLTEQTIALVEKTDSSNSMFEEVAPYAKQASEWVIIAIVIAFLLWVVKQFEDMFNAAFR